MKKDSILVVEDEDIMRESLVDWFSGEDHQVDAASDGDKALADFDLEDYDVMIVDLKLPGRDGLSVLSEVRVKNPKAKVVIITAYPSVDTAVEAMPVAPPTTWQNPLSWNGSRRPSEEDPTFRWRWLRLWKCPCPSKRRWSKRR
jgi:DNA-binding NtrC family response regulator